MGQKKGHEQGADSYAGGIHSGIRVARPVGAFGVPWGSTGKIVHVPKAEMDARDDAALEAMEGDEAADRRSRNSCAGGFG